MRGLAVDGEPLQFLVGFDQQGAAGSFVGAPRFHPHEAISLSVLSRSTGPSFVPLTEVGVPASNPISTSSALSGAFSGATTHCHIASLGALAGSSSSPPS